MNNKKDLLVDVDEVIVFSGFLNAVNDFLKTSYVIDDFTDYYIDEAAIPKERMGEFNEFLKTYNLYAHPQILPGAIEGLRTLSEYYNIYPYSACVNPMDIQNSGRLFKDKYDLLIELLPFIPPTNFIFTNTKKFIRGDVMIDDRLPNLVTNDGVKILFPSYHNRDIPESQLTSLNVIRAGYNWQDGWKYIVKFLIDINQERKK